MNESKLQELIGEQLYDAQDNWKCRCPFHDEKTASFFIHKTDYICHCFGCGVSGTVEGIIWKLHPAIPPSESREILGIEPRMGRLKSPNDAPAKPLYFPNSWLAPWPRLASHPYLEKRGFTPKTIESFGARWDKTQKRVVFPLKTWQPHSTTLVGAAGRATDDREPKWYYYWNCQKSKNVFYIEPEEPSHEDLYVVEGITDMMRLWQHGYKACALLGSKPSKEQLTQIKKLTNKVIIALDNDEAGHTGGEMLEAGLKNSCDIWYINFPEQVNDVGELWNQGDLDFVVTNFITPLEKRLHGNRLSKSS